MMMGNVTADDSAAAPEDATPVEVEAAKVLHLHRHKLAGMTYSQRMAVAAIAGDAVKAGADLASRRRTPRIAWLAIGAANAAVVALALAA